MALASNDNPDYILLLNPDAIALTGAVTHLVKFLDTHSRVGIVDSSIENGNVKVSAHKYSSPFSEFESFARLGFITCILSRYIISPAIQQNAHECDCISGASFMLRSSMVEQIGGMDDSFFLYYEEIDYRLRAKIKAGLLGMYLNLE